MTVGHQKKNNQLLARRSTLLGLRQSRLRGDEYGGLIEEIRDQAVQAALPEMLHPMGKTFGTINAVPILERYRNEFCNFFQ